MSKIYKTSLGKSVDMAALQSRNEKVRAVGNMSVNARGDIIDSNNNVIQDSTKRVNRMYQRTMQNPAPLKRAPVDSVDKSVAEKKTETVAKIKKVQPDVETYQPTDDLDDDIPNPEK